MKNIRFLLWIPIAVITMAMLSCSDKAEQIIIDPNAEEQIEPLTVTPFDIKKGVNVSHWLAASSKRGDERRNFFTQSEVQKLKAMGFDHLRLPVDEEQLFDKEGVIDEEALGLLKDCIGWCQTAGMKIIVDMHTLRSHNDKAVNASATGYKAARRLWLKLAEQEKFRKEWKILAEELSAYPNDLVAFELLNEPVAPYATQWNALSANLVRDIRATQPERKLIIGPNGWNNINQLGTLTLPRKDANIILTFHFYTPHLLTHYRSEWTGYKDIACNVNYPGELISAEDFNALTKEQQNYIRGQVGSYDRKTLEKEIEKAVKRAKELGGVQLYCGEYGCYHYAPRTARIAWTADVSSILAAAGIAYSYWEYKGGGYSFCKENGEIANEELYHAIIQ